MGRSQSSLIIHYLITICVAVGLAFFIRAFVIEAYRIPSSSMSPTLVPGDTLFVAKWPYSSWYQMMEPTSQPQYGDIVVFTGTEHSGSFRLDYIKRIVGLPGDEISLQNGSVILKGQSTLVQLTEKTEPGCHWEKLPNGKSYPACWDVSTGIPSFESETIPAGSVFVLGDTRSLGGSKKRRGWGLVSMKALKGRALWLWLSIHPESSSIRKERIFRSIQ